MQRLDKQYGTDCARSLCSDSLSNVGRISGSIADIETGHFGWTVTEYNHYFTPASCTI